MLSKFLPILTDEETTVMESCNEMSMDGKIVLYIACDRDIQNNILQSI